jgi:large subunit ribosomal protein L24
MKIKTGDEVKVISGHYKGTVATVKAVFPKEHKVIVEGVNMVKKALKPSQANPEGGIVEKEAKIDVSNVMLYDKKAKTASRVGYKFDDNGKKVRYYKKSGSVVKEDKK